MGKKLESVICTVDSCNKRIHGKGLCNMHRQRVERSGNIGLKTREYENHNMASSAEYLAWYSMKRRCYVKDNISYKHYGGRGIKVCDEWLDSFIKFYEHIGKKPTSKHSLDRIDTNGNYEPGNVRWATPNQQAANKRIPNTNTSGYKGVYFEKRTKKWKAHITLNYKYITIGRYETAQQANHARITFDRDNI